jgi:hypothetical protein
MTDTDMPTNLPEFFLVWSTATVNGHHDTPITWFAYRPDCKTPDLPWDKVIEDYDPAITGIGYTRHSFVEYFNKAEAEALLAHLERVDPEGKPSIQRAELPVANWTLGFTHFADACDDNHCTFPLPLQPGETVPCEVHGFASVAPRYEPKPPGPDDPF